MGVIEKARRIVGERRLNAAQKAKNVFTRRANARKHLLDFILYTNPFYYANWHHAVICDELEAWIEGDTLRLALFLPPQHGKSEIVSRNLPAFLLGIHPDVAVIACSYTSSLATAMNRDVQRIIDNPRYATLFPATQLYSKNIRTIGRGNWLRNSDEFEVVNRKGYYKCAGTGGSITGRPMDYGIIDDPVKGRSDTNSAKERDKLFGWYNTVFRTRRKSEFAKILLTLTRWHDDDLAGRLLNLAKQNADADQWNVITFPALCEASDRHQRDHRQDGEALWPLKGTVRHFDDKSLQTTRVSIGPFDWLALYQQRPTLAKGAIFQSDQFKFFGEERRYDGLYFLLEDPEQKVRRLLPARVALWQVVTPHSRRVTTTPTRWSARLS